MLFCEKILLAFKGHAMLLWAWQLYKVPFKAPGSFSNTYSTWCAFATVSHHQKHQIWKNVLTASAFYLPIIPPQKYGVQHVTVVTTALVMFAELFGYILQTVVKTHVHYAMGLTSKNYQT